MKSEKNQKVMITKNVNGLGASQTIWERCEMKGEETDRTKAMEINR